MQSSFPQPTTREFVLEVLDPMPTFPDGPDEEETLVRGIWDTRPLTRRMYACFKESEARFVESVSKDSLYA